MLHALQAARFDWCSTCCCAVKPLVQFMQRIPAAQQQPNSQARPGVPGIAPTARCQLHSPRASKAQAGQGSSTIDSLSSPWSSVQMKAHAVAPFAWAPGHAAQPQLAQHTLAGLPAPAAAIQLPAWQPQLPRTPLSPTKEQQQQREVWQQHQQQQLSLPASLHPPLPQQLPASMHGHLSATPQARRHMHSSSSSLQAGSNKDLRGSNGTAVNTADGTQDLEDDPDEGEVLLDDIVAEDAAADVIERVVDSEWTTEGAVSTSSQVDYLEDSADEYDVEFDEDFEWEEENEEGLVDELPGGDGSREGSV